MGYSDPELVSRWFQLGVFSPINRLHSSNNNFILKEPWTFGKVYEHILKKALRLRHQLFPYIYTMNYRCHKELEPLVQPMYYANPKNAGAYENKNQFMFGSELLVCPITEPLNSVTGLSKATGWLPKGEWFDFFSGTHYSSKNRTMSFYRALEDYPVFAKAGAIVPMNAHKENDNFLGSSDKMEVYVFPAASNSFTLYEDEGEYDRFEKGAFATTDMTLQFGKKAIFNIAAAKGDTSLIPKSREWKINLRGFNKDITVKAFVNGKEVKVEDIYDSATLTTSVTLTAKTSDEITVEVMGENLITDNGDIKGKIEQILINSQIAQNSKLKFFEAANFEGYSGLNRYRRMQNVADPTYEERYVLEAIKEQLTLSADIYEDWDGIKHGN